jgi:GT2 family glycosyltransferase
MTHDMSREPVVSVIIVTWNTRDLAVQCMEALYARADGVPFETIVVDSGSSDGTVEALRTRYPATVFVENDRNLGFPRSNNQGLALARGRYVLLLNSDTIIGEGTLAACVAELDREPDIGMVGCRLVYPDGRVQNECARNPYLLRHLAGEVLFLHMLFPRHRVWAHHLMGDWDHMDSRDVEAISGAFMLVRREVARGVGGLPEDLLAYHEDLSFCLRIRQQGWRIRYLADVSTIHIANQATNRSRQRFYLLEGEYKVRLIRESEGAAFAAAARAVFGVRSAIRLAVATAGMLPGLGRVRQKHPNLFDVERQFLQLAWSVWPGSVERLVPSVANQPPRPAVPDPARAR